VQICEVDTDGEVLRQFSGSGLLSLRWPDHLDIDSHGSILVADRYSQRVLALDSRLRLRRVIVDEHQLGCSKPLYGLHYDEPTGRLLLALEDSVAVFVL